LRASAPRHVVLAQGPGRWADPARTATDVAAAIRLIADPDDADPDGADLNGANLGGAGRESGWLASWRAADAAAGAAAGRLLDSGDELTEPRLARDTAALLPDGALLWAASSLPIRDLDQQAAPRAGVLVTSNRGASGIDGLVSCAIGAALAHQAAGGGRAAALLGDLALLHDSAGLFLGPGEPRPDLCLIVVNNDGGGIFSALEQAAFPGPFERVFGTPHGTDLEQLAGAAAVPYFRLTSPADLPGVLTGSGLRLVEVRTGRAEGARLRAAIGRACADAIDAIS
jgi:2-succinyl-5-enolpyruvyl-6-hydroxy-3-cyclohexene-1-carboxylate synthase